VDSGAAAGLRVDGIHQASNVIFLGPRRVGKTHLTVALAEAAIRADLEAYCITAHDLATDLGRAYREGRPGDRQSRLPALRRFGNHDFLPVGECAVRTKQHHPDLEQELRRLGFDFRRPRHRDRNPGSVAAPLGDH